jgi:hypothetical protein
VTFYVAVKHSISLFHIESNRVAELITFHVYLPFQISVLEKPSVLALEFCLICKYSAINKVVLVQFSREIFVSFQLTEMFA